MNAKYFWTSADRQSQWAIFLIWEPAIDLTDEHVQNSANGQPVNSRWKDKAHNIMNFINRNPEEKEIPPQSKAKGPPIVKTAI